MQSKSLQAQFQKSRLTIEYEQILKDTGGCWDEVKEGYLPEDFVLTTRREEIEWVQAEGVYEIGPMQECEDAGKKRLFLIWVHTDKSVDLAHQKNRSRLCAKAHKTKEQC